VPYPYAIDIDNNYYLLTEYVVISNHMNEIKQYDDPYEYYYSNNNIVKSQFNYICDYYIGTIPCMLTFKSNPNYDYDNIISRNDGLLYIKKINDDELYELTKNDYINLIQDFGSYMGYSKLLNKIIICQP